LAALATLAATAMTAAMQDVTKVEFFKRMPSREAGSASTFSVRSRRAP
jgi:hypothetical protein